MIKTQVFRTWLDVYKSRTDVTINKGNNRGEPTDIISRTVVADAQIFDGLVIIVEGTRHQNSGKI